MKFPGLLEFPGRMDTLLKGKVCLKEITRRSNSGAGIYKC